MDYLAAMRSFVRAVDLGRLSRAAHEPGAKVSTISRHISALEAEVGAALLNRSTHRLRLTEVGAVLHPHALRIVAHVDALRGLASSLNHTPQGLLRVSLPAAFGRRHVMPHLAAFLDAYPAIRVDATLTDVHVDLIKAGADVAIRIGTLPDSRLVARRFAPHRRVACASPACIARDGPVAEPADLARHNALIFSLQPTTSWYFRSHRAGRGPAPDLAGTRGAGAWRAAVPSPGLGRQHRAGLREGDLGGLPAQEDRLPQGARLHRLLRGALPQAGLLGRRPRHLNAVRDPAAPGRFHKKARLFFF